MLNRRHLNIIKKKIVSLADNRNLFRYILNSTKLFFTLKNRSASSPYPNSIMLELTNHCQLRCITCAREYIFGENMNKGNMSFQKAKSVIDELYPYLDKIGLTGLGEPLIYPELEEIVDYIRKVNKGIAIFISTNAQLPNTVSIIEKLKDKIDTLQVSIDGIGEVFDNIRQNSDFKEFTENVKEISKISRTAQFDVKLNMVVFKGNYFQMSDVIEFASQHSIKEVFFNTVNLVANDWDISNYDIYKTDEFKIELEKAYKTARIYNIVLDFPKTDSEKGFRHCPYIRNNFYVSWDGFLVPCCAKPFPKEKNFGKVFENSFLYCANSDEFKAFRKMSNENIAPDFCKRCHYVL